MARVLLIANQYANLPQYSLYGCFNDIDNIKTRFLKMNPSAEIIVMKDNLPVTSPLFPTRQNIITQFTALCTSPKSKLFFYYSGHGTSITDYNGDEQSIKLSTNGNQVFKIESMNQDSCMVSNDITYLNIITDDELCIILQKLKSSQTLYAFMDSCNSGTGMDLCYVNMCQYSSNFTSTTLKSLQEETLKKCSIVKANYPIKLNNVKGNVILISGTRDNSYSYEGTINNIESGYFTCKLCILLDIDSSTYSLKNFYYTLIGLINNKSQIPVITLSRDLNLDTFMMNDFKVTPNTSLITALNKNLSVIKTINFINFNEYINNETINYSGLLKFYLMKQYKTKKNKKT